MALAGCAAQASTPNPPAAPVITAAQENGLRGELRAIGPALDTL